MLMASSLHVVGFGKRDEDQLLNEAIKYDNRTLRLLKWSLLRKTWEEPADLGHPRLINTLSSIE